MIIIVLRVWLPANLCWLRFGLLRPCEIHLQWVAGPKNWKNHGPKQRNCKTQCSGAIQIPAFYGKRNNNDNIEAVSALFHLYFLWYWKPEWISSEIFEENLGYLPSPTITTFSYTIKSVIYCFQECQEIARELEERRKQEEIKSKKVRFW